jgi:Family of unknown function (DUF6064)
MTPDLQLPFSRDAFLEVFGAYNTLVWPVAAILWIATLLTFVACLRGHSRDAWTFGLLAFLWAWSGIVYHAALFSWINPAAWSFALVFVIEAGLLTWFGVVRRTLHLRSTEGTLSTHMGYGFIAYGLLYPFLCLIGPNSYPLVPTFGVPCPTTLVTIGFLLLVHSVPLSVTIVPLMWTVIGGSAAFVLGMPIDLALVAAGGALGAHLWVTRVGRPRLA